MSPYLLEQPARLVAGLRGHPYPVHAAPETCNPERGLPSGRTAANAMVEFAAVVLASGLRDTTTRPTSD